MAVGGESRHEATSRFLNGDLVLMSEKIKFFLGVCIISVALHVPCDARSLRVFAVGNSFSANATQFLPQVVEDGGHEIDVRVAYKGGGSLKEHWDALEAGLANPDDPKAHIYKEGKSLAELLNGEKWDVITLQQYSKHSTDISSYRPYIENLFAYLKNNYPDAEIVIHQTWAYRKDSKDWGRISEGEFTKNQREMFEYSRGAYHRMAEKFGARVIPVGDAFWRVDSDPNWGFEEPAKALSYPDLPDEAHSLHAGYRWVKKGEFKFDSHHANAAGKYLGALVWYATLFEESPEDIRFKPDVVDSAFAAVLRKAAAESVAELKIADSFKGWKALSYPKSETLLGVEFDKETRRTEAQGIDIRPKTWADDGNQYAAFGDGGGFGGDNGKGRASLGVARIEGGAEDYVGKNVWGGFEAENEAGFA